MKTKKILAISAGLLALNFVGAAQADIRATAVVDITNLTINLATGGVVGAQLSQGTDVTVTAFTNSGDQDVTLGAATAGQTNPGGTTDFDFAVDCIGACAPVVENAFAPLSGATAGNFAAADQRDIGSPIIGLGAGFTQNSVDVSNASYIGIDTGSIAASANSNNNLNAGFNFQLANATALAFVFDVSAYLEAFVTADETAPSFATAAYSVSFTIANLSTGGNIVFSLVPALLNASISLNAPVPVDLTNTGGLHAIGVATTASIEAITPILNNSDIYQLSARINTNVDGQRVVPEPSSIALLGMGLLGFAAKFRRRNVL